MTDITPITDEELEQIEAGLPGVTHGPWEWTCYDHSTASLGNGPDAGSNPECDHVFSVSLCRSCSIRHEGAGWHWGRCATIGEKDAAYIARMDPDTVASMIARIQADAVIIAELRGEIKKLRKLVQQSYNEGMNSGMDEFRTQRGGNVWQDSNTRAALNKEGGE